uniref:Odorant receptor n=1 Tax=Sirex nitobei TaxID=1602346 RepID=A0A857NA04_9HYME|nr:odorant receptor 17 [Sirex nitobei]
METSMNASRDLEFAIEWNRIMLQFLGIWPNSKNGGRTLDIRFLFAVFFMLCLNASQIVYLIMVRGQLDLMIEVLAKAIALTTTALLKLISVWRNSKVLSSLLSDVIEDWMMPKSKQDREVMLKNAKVARMLSIGGISLILVTLSIYVLNHVILDFLTRMRNVPDYERQLLYQAYFPFDTDKSPNYELTCVVQTVGAVYTAMSYSGIDTLIAMLVLHLCAQFTNLQFALTNLVSEVECTKRMVFREQLATIVNKHKRLNRFAESIEKSFNALLLVHMLFCTLQFCIIGYNFISAIDSSANGRLSLYQFVFLTIYVISSVLQLFVYCYVGEKLNNESTNLSYAAYQSEWYKLSVQETRDMMFVMLRAKAPMQITAGKFCSFSLVLFSDILKASMGYLSVLLSVRD